MRFAYLSLAPPNKKYVDGLAYKGATFFRLPDYDAMRLSRLSAGLGDFIYVDERVEDARTPPGTDLAVIPVHAPVVNRAFELAKQLQGQGITVVMFGRYATLKPRSCARHCNALVRGDPTAVWADIVGDVRNKRLRPVYEGSGMVSFDVDRRWEDKLGMFPLMAQLHTTVGCTCSGTERAYCVHGVYNPDVKTMDQNEAIAAVAAIRKKIVWLLDDDAFFDPARAEFFFRHVWQFRKQWIVQASERVFVRPGLLRVLRDSGVRIIILKEDWMPFQLLLEWRNAPQLLKQKRRQVDAIHHRRILAGARIRLDLKAGQTFNPWELHDVLRGLRVDFVELSMTTPIAGSPKYQELKRRGQLATENPDLYNRHNPVVRTSLSPDALVDLAETFRDRFYSWDGIITRCAKTFSRVGIYNTILFNLSTNLAYRENHLEHAGFPP